MKSSFRLPGRAAFFICRAGEGLPGPQVVDERLKISFIDQAPSAELERGKATLRDQFFDRAAAKGETALNFGEVEECCGLVRIHARDYARRDTRPIPTNRTVTLYVSCTAPDRQAAR